MVRKKRITSLSTPQEKRIAKLQSQEEELSAEELLDISGREVPRIRIMKGKKIEGEYKREEPRRLIKLKNPKIDLKKLFKKRGSIKATRRRATGTRRLLTATGVISGSATGSGPGRPKGTGKYQRMGYAGVHDYRRAMASKKAQYRQYQMEQVARMRQARGLTEEQVQQLQFERTKREPPQPKVVMREGADPRIIQAQQVNELADDELNFRRWSAQKTVSPNTQRMLMQLRKIQNMGKTANIEQQRRHFERRLISDNSNLLRAHENMQKVDIDFTGVGSDNPLMAENIFRRQNAINILRTERGNILDTSSHGNNLKFF